MEEKRELICPAIYKHFKNEICDNSIPNNYMYCTKFVSEPVPLEDIKNSKFKMNIEAWHTENEDIVYLYLINGTWYHDMEDEKNRLVIYTPLYDNHMNYARPYDMFMGPVDKDKYPDIKQYWRMELVM